VLKQFEEKLEKSTIAIEKKNLESKKLQAAHVVENAKNEMENAEIEFKDALKNLETVESSKFGYNPKEALDKIKEMEKDISELSSTVKNYEIKTVEVQEKLLDIQRAISKVETERDTTQIDFEILVTNIRTTVNQYLHNVRMTALTRRMLSIVKQTVEEIIFPIKEYTSIAEGSLSQPSTFPRFQQQNVQGLVQGTC